jgi:hypothetical protein
MLTAAVESYIAMRRACGFDFKSEGITLKGFGAFSDARGQHHVRSNIAIQWAGQARSRYQRARRLGMVIRFARYVHAEDPRHQVPPAILGPERAPTGSLYFLSAGYSTLDASGFASRLSNIAPSDLQHTFRAARVYRVAPLRSHPSVLCRHYSRWLGDQTHQVPQEQTRVHS